MKIAKHYRPELVVSKGKEPNPLLTDPYLDAKEDRIVASNGRSLVALPVETEKGERSRYLACSLLEAARKLGDPDVPAEIDDQEIVEYGVLWPAAQERTFPDWQRLLPKHRRGSPGTITIALNARLLKQVADAMGTGGGVRLVVQQDDEEAPILVEPLTSDPEEIGLLMPMRDGEPLDEGQQCPKCKRLLAAGAPCPEHGAPTPPVNGGTPAARRSGDPLAGLVGTREEAMARRSGGEIEQLFWEGSGNNLVAEVTGGTYAIEPATADGRRPCWWTPVSGRSKRIGNGRTIEQAKDVVGEHHRERLADALLKNAGAGALTAGELKGPAVARKKGGRRG